MFQQCCNNDWVCPCDQARQQFGPAPVSSSCQQSRQSKPYTPMDGKHSISISTARGDYSSPDSNTNKQSHYVMERFSAELPATTITSPSKVQFSPRSPRLDQLDAMIEDKRRQCNTLMFECKRRQVGYGKILLVTRNNFKTLNNKYRQQMRELDRIESIVSHWEKSKRRIVGWSHHQ